MDAKQAKALREPFPAATIGKLPKPYKSDSAKGTCRECGGYHGLPAAHLDYVGHAAATDRLLQVDPDWSWEPFALDANGLPMMSGQNLWIRLTVAGVTRIGVGDGKSLKECIGDAIRNAAMRFGVALDLWAKEDLQAMAAERGEVPADTEAAPVEPPPTRTMSRPRPATARPATARPSAEPEILSPAQLTKVNILLREQGMTERTAALTFVGQIVGREVDSTKTLSKAEAHRIIEMLSEQTPTPADAPTSPTEPFWGDPDADVTP